MEEVYHREEGEHRQRHLERSRVNLPPQAEPDHVGEREERERRDSNQEVRIAATKSSSQETKRRGDQYSQNDLVI